MLGACSFTPKDDEESHLLNDEQQFLGFNPTLKSHQLTAKNESSKRSAKRVLKRLTQATLRVRRSAGVVLR